MGKALTMIGVHKEPAYPLVHRQNYWFMGMDFCTHKKNDGRKYWGNLSCMNEKVTLY